MRAGSIVRDQNDLIIVVVTEFIRPGRVGRSRKRRADGAVDHRATCYIQHPHSAHSIADPNLGAVSDEHTIGAGRVVVPGGTDETRLKLIYHLVGAGINDIDRCVGAIGQEVARVCRIHKADVKGAQLLIVRQIDDAGHSEYLVLRCGLQGWAAEGSPVTVSSQGAIAAPARRADSLTFLDIPSSRLCSGSQSTISESSILTAPNCSKSKEFFCYEHDTRHDTSRYVMISLGYLVINPRY